MIPSLTSLGVNPSDLLKRQTRGVSQAQMVKAQMRVANEALARAVRELIALDEKLTDETLKARVRDDDYSTFKLIFTPYVTELIYHHRTPEEYRTKVKALRGKLVVSGPSMKNYISRLSRTEYREGIGRLCTTVLSEAFSCLGLFGTKMIPLLFREQDDTITLVDSATESSNHHWPNVDFFYDRLYSHSVGVSGNFDGLRLEEFPEMAGKEPFFEKVHVEVDKSDPPLTLLTSIAYVLN